MKTNRLSETFENKERRNDQNKERTKTSRLS